MLNTLQQFTILKNHNLPPRVNKYWKENDKFGGNLFKRILSTKIVIFSYPKLLSFSVLTFIK